MFRLKSISLQFRLFLVGVSLLSVLFLNKREVAISLEKPVPEQTLKAGSRQLVIKEKVSFEAVPSCVVLPQALIPEFFSFEFPAIQVPVALQSAVVPVVVPLFQRLLFTAISPNAP
jgi:hypothetical protein